jgi:hypothetical protein
MQTGYAGRSGCAGLAWTTDAVGDGLLGWSPSRRRGASAMSSNPLVGTWRLVSWENRTLDGEVSHPLGDDASGYIAYTEDGYVAGDLLSGSAAEKAGAAETYVSYCGRYEFHGETVLHHVELSLFPNWVGVTQERLVRISGDRLTLSTRPLLLQGRQQTAHLLWERAHKSLRLTASPRV